MVGWVVVWKKEKGKEFMVTQTREKSFADTLRTARVRVEEMRPVDRWANLQWFDFAPGENRQCSLIPLKDSDVRHLPVLQLGELALSQLLARVGYPLHLIDRLPIKLSHLSVNWLIQNHMAEKQALIRTICDNQARAVLSHCYTPLDDIEVLTLAEPYLEGSTVRWEAFGERSTHISVTWPEEAQSGMIRGLHLANSEVGVRSVTIEAILYRPACANILPAVGSGGDGDGYDPYRIRDPRSNARPGQHRMGALAGQQAGGWRFIHTGDKTRLESFVRDAIEDTKRSGDALIARYQQALTKQVDAIGAVEELSKEAKLTQEQFKNALSAMMEEPMGQTVAAVANAFSRAAQKEEDPDERHYVQGVGTRALLKM